MAGDDAKAASKTSSKTTEAPAYVVVRGQVDKATYNGYRRYHSKCHACHGQDASGGTFAPSLVESLKLIDHATFSKIVLEGRQTKNFAGEIIAMPAYGKVSSIAKHVDDIYIYLKARSDGALRAGRPKRLQ